MDYYGTLPGSFTILSTYYPAFSLKTHFPPFKLPKFYFIFYTELQPTLDILGWYSGLLIAVFKMLCSWVT